MANTVIEANYPDRDQSQAIAGKLWLMYYNYGDGATEENPIWNKLGATRDTPISISADSIDATTKDEDGWGASIQGTKSWSSSLELVCKSDDQSFYVLREWMFSDDLQSRKPALQIALVNKATKEYYVGWCVITSMSLSASYSDVSTWSFELQGVGPLTVKDNWVDPT